MRKILFSLLLFTCIIQAVAQQTITGVVTDAADGSPLPGVTITVKGANTAAMSDLDGKFSLNAPSDATLIFTFMGYKTQEVAVSAQSVINVQLEVDDQTIEEVVVTGYGVQKKSVVTGSISSVKSKDLEKLPIGRIEQTMQGRIAGVTIASNSGQPGSSSTIRVRGITTFNDNAPLYVIDGIVVDEGGIGYINQSDIESIEVLKDASSLAIYGARSANGVILVTTKKGASKGKFNVNYNGYYGISSPERKMNLLNATEYATLMNEKSIAAGGGIVFADPASYGEGTDWQDAIFNNSAVRYSNEISISGGNNVSTFFISFGARDQEGIVATDISNYNSKNFRLNSTHKLSKYVTIGETFGYSHQKTIGIGSLNSEYGGVLSSAVNLDPITQMVITDPVEASVSPYTDPRVLRDDAGNPYGISSLVGQEITNPLAYQKTRLGNHDWSDDFVGNVFLEITPIKGLKFKSSLGGKLAYWGTNSFTPEYYLNATTLTSQNNLYRTNNQGMGFSIENTLSYNRNMGNHNFEILLGQGAYGDGYVKSSGVTYFDLPVSSYDDASFNFGATTEKKDSWASEGVEHKVTSLFARLNYDFNGRYLFTGIIRRDGSSRFGSNKKYGIFPSFSAGWMASKEEFWPQNNIVTQLKIRGGYGVTGNDGIGDFGYVSTISSGRNYTFGDANSIQPGYSPDAPENPDLQWEETKQTNIGLEAMLFNTLSLTFDYYIKKSTDILQPVEIPGYVGSTGSPQGNVADMENNGFEVELGYRKSFGDINFSANANFAYLKNEVTYVGLGKTEITGGAAFQSMGSVTVTKVGMPFNSFFGYEYNGIFQNQDEVDAYVNTDGDLLCPYAKPGDLRWIDQNSDGIIDENDRVNLGNSLPKYTYGLTLNADYKGFDVMVFMQGAAGNKIFQGFRRLDILNSNYSNKALGRWTGEGTSNSYPRLTNDDANHNFDNMSNLYLEKGDYLRLKILQLGYSLPENLIGKIGANRLRLYISAENLITFTKYTGFDPEIGGGVFGIDKGYYPQARTFMFGVNLQF